MKTIRLPFRLKKSVLATGADLKGAFAFAKGDMAYLVDGFGDLANLDNLARFEEAIRLYGRKLGIKPKAIACDHHPGYFSTRFAEMYGLEHLITELSDIQHHEAHIASAIVDNQIKGNVIGVAFDGTGFGWDGCIWGGEFFVGSPKQFKRAAHLEYVPMPGGDAAIKEPWRMAAVHLYGTFGKDFLGLKMDFTRRLDRSKWNFVRKMIENNVNSPLTSSAGRLFDAVSAIVLCKMKSDFEAELPIELERIVSRGRFDSYEFNIRSEGDRFLIGYRKLFEGIVKDILKGMGRATISAKFHNTVAKVIVEVASRLKRKTRIGKVVLSGGVFQNGYLAARAATGLRKKGFEVFTHSGVNTNDSGIPIGQIAIAHARSRCV